MKEEKNIWAPVLEKMGCSDENQIKFLSEFAESFNTQPIGVDFNINDIQHMTLPYILKYLKSTNIHNIDYSFSEQITNCEILFEMSLEEINLILSEEGGDKDVMVLNHIFKKNVYNILDEKLSGISQIQLQNQFLNIINDGVTLKVLMYCKIGRDRTENEILNLIKNNLDNDKSIELTSPLMVDDFGGLCFVIFDKNNEGQIFKKFKITVESYK